MAAVSENKVVCVEEQFETVVKKPAAQVWKALVEDGHCTIPAMLPDRFESIQVVEGKPGHPGTTWLVKLGPNSKLAKHGHTWAKVKFEEIDTTNRVLTCNLVEGGGLGKFWHSLTHTIKLMAHPSNQHHTILHHTIKCQNIGDHKHHLTYKEVITHVCNSGETYLIANPNYGCVSN